MGYSFLDETFLCNFCRDTNFEVSFLHWWGLEGVLGVGGVLGVLAGALGALVGVGEVYCILLRVGGKHKGHW